MKSMIVIGLAAAAAALSACSSCAMDPEVVSVWGGDVSLPRFLGLEVVSAREVRASFSSPVTLVTASVSLAGTGAAGGEPAASDEPAARDEPAEMPGTVSWEDSPGSGTILMNLAEAPGIGTRAVLEATVRDGKGNTLSFAAPFTGFNDRVAGLRINEVRTDYSKPKVEFVEFLVTAAGNLAGMEFFIAGNTASPVWEFPAAEVVPGDYVVYHLRSVEEGLVNETGGVSASSGVDSCPDARDFWDVQSKAPLKETNVLLLRSRKGGSLQDAFLCAEAGRTEWPTDALRLAALEAFEAGLWSPGPLVSDAFCSTGMTVTRTAGRNPAPAASGAGAPGTAGAVSSAACWRICATSRASPGRQNAVWSLE